jgi:hypothetical protein
VTKEKAAKHMPTNTSRKWHTRTGLADTSMAFMSLSHKIEHLFASGKSRILKVKKFQQYCVLA